MPCSWFLELANCFLQSMALACSQM
uniref:Uncharacterized protein n=1 Tax=Arundo donax TaxID=35708 RepID=A0A0A9C4Y3_ARUDO